MHRLETHMICNVGGQFTLDLNNSNNNNNKDISAGLLGALQTLQLKR